MPYLVPGSVGSLAYRAPDGQAINPTTGRMESYRIENGQKVFASEQQAQADAIAAAHQNDRYRGALGWASHYVAPVVKAGVLGVVAGGAGAGTLAALGGAAGGASGGVFAPGTGAASTFGLGGAGGGMGWLSLAGQVAPSLVQGAFGAYGANKQGQANDRSAELLAQSTAAALAFEREKEMQRQKEYADKLAYDRAQAEKQQAEAKAAWDAQEGRRAPFRQASEGVLAQLAQKFGLPYTPSQSASSGPPPGWTPGDPVGSRQPASNSLASMTPPPMPTETASVGDMQEPSPMPPQPVAADLPPWWQQRMPTHPDDQALNTLTRYGRRA